MPKYIDVGAINWYDDLFMKGINNSGVWVRYKDVESLIRNAPAADVEPVRHGRWIKSTGMMPPEFAGNYHCSECGWHGISAKEREYKRCPECGARMDEEADNVQE